MRIGDTFCPGVLHAVPARDGLLIRVRLPGGLLTPQQLGTIAELSSAYTDGEIEITSRANLQLRAIQPNHLPLIVHTLTDNGLVPSATHDRVRNLISSPLAGLDPTELVDTRSMLHALDQALIHDPSLAGLPPKFSFGLDGGGTWFSRETDDLALQAFLADGVLQWRLLFGGIGTSFACTSDDAVRTLLAVASACLSTAARLTIPARARTLRSQPGAVDSILADPTLGLVPFRASPATAPRAITELMAGIYPIGASASYNLIPSIPLGRIDSVLASKVAALAAEYKADLRLAPWRGLVLGNVAGDQVPSLAARLQAAGLCLDGRDGNAGLSACAGIQGCDSALADVRGDAAQLARALAGYDPKPGWTVSFSGCEKRCAMRKGATLELVATPAGYQITQRDTPLPGVFPPGPALKVIQDAHAQAVSEVNR